MIHGDIVTLTSEGIVVQEKALQPLGIFDQSICWGVWAANPHEKQPLYKHPNLIISPLHPSSWPFLIQLQLILRNRKGALAEVCKILKDHDLSILFAECAPTGFTHATLNLIAESTKDNLKALRIKKEAFDKDNPRVRVPPTSSYKKARQIANSIAAYMFVHAKEIEQALESKIAEEKDLRSKQPDSCIFHGWDAVGSHFLYNGEKVADTMLALTSKSTREECLEYIQAHIPKPARVHYMHRLAYFSLYGGGRYHEVPFSLRYQASSAFLKLEGKEIFSEGTFSTDLNPLPRPAICTFNSEDKYLRLNPLTSKLLKDKLTTIGVEYTVKGTHRRDARASQGLLWLVSEQLRNADVDLLHVSNKWTKLEYAYEAGRMSFIADVATDKYEALEKDISSIKKPEELRNLEHTNLGNVTVEEYPQKKLFVSLHFGHPRDDNIRERIHRVARERGFEDALVETHVLPATRSVLDIIGDCHAFLQLLSFRADENPEAMSFSWLDFEYGVATGKGIPTIRLVDVVRVPYDWWMSKITINKDQRAKEFRSDVSDDEVVEQIREAVEELARELTKRQQ